MVVGRVEDFAYSLGVGALFDSLYVLSLSKQAHIKAAYVARFPKTKQAYRLAVCARDHHVVCTSLDFFAVLVNYLALAVFKPLFLYSAAETYFENSVASRNKPYFSSGQPYVGQLYLKSVNKLLLEKTVFVEYRKTWCRVVER